LVPLDPDRIGELERLGRRRERVRHRDVYRRRAVAVGAGALAAADRLVVGEAVVAEGDVVHRPLALRWDVDRIAEGEEDDIRDPARGLDVARGDRGGRAGVDEGAFGSPDGHRREGTAGSGRIRIGQAADDEVAGGARYRERAVEVSLVLGRGAGEVELELVAVDRQRRS